MNESQQVSTVAAHIPMSDQLHAELLAVGLYVGGAADAEYEPMRANDIDGFAE